MRMSQLDRLTPLVVYSLKRQYGGPIDIYHLVSSSTAAKTGVKTVSTTKYSVSRAIVMPAGYSRTRLPSIVGEANNVIGGSRDMSVRDFIVDRKDTTGLTTLNADDWIVYQSRKFQIQSVEAYELDAAWLITAKELVGEVPQQTYAATVDSELGLTETQSGTV
jgi:hypothetical protein